MTDSVRGGAPLEEYLGRLEAELKPLPVEERREIVLETRSHVLERASRLSGGGVEDVLGDLGPPADYARQFLPATEAAMRPLAVLTGLSPWILVPLLVALVLLYGLAALATGVAIAKLMNPAGVGLWFERVDGLRHVTFRVSPSGGGPPGEVIGWWLVLIGFGVAILIHITVVAALRRLGRRQQQR